MTDKEMLDALKTLIKPLERQIEDLTLEVKVNQRAIRRDIHALQDAQDTLIAVLEAKNILPKAENL